MKKFLSSMCFLMILLLLVMCSERGRRLEGKWYPAGMVIGVTPSSYWFKGNGTVVANWMTQQAAFRSVGVYRFIDDKRIKITMIDGYYKGRTYHFDILKNDEDELILGDKYQDIKLKKENDR